MRRLAIGIALLALYNLAYIVPLVGLLSAVSDRRVLGRLGRWNHSNSPWVKVALAVAVHLNVGLDEHRGSDLDPVAPRREQLRKHRQLKNTGGVGKLDEGIATALGRGFLPLGDDRAGERDASRTSGGDDVGVADDA